MCEVCGAPPPGSGLDRRRLLAGAAATAGALAGAALVGPGAAATAPRAQVALGGGVTITPRSAWGGDLPTRGPLEAEAPGDVRFLLVHHTVSENGYAPGEVPGLLRGIYAFHTGAEKGWPDIAYNFFVDAHGGVWEGRTGSLDAPIKGSATGGSQGYAQLCCFVGDHQVVAPTEAAQASMVALLAWLASRYGIDPSPGATATFTSRGSQRWPAGTAVTTTTIGGHREMSNTVCPGDAAYALVRESFPARVTAAVGTAPRPGPSTTGPSTTGPSTTGPSTTGPSTTAPTTAPTTAIPPSSTTTRPASPSTGGGSSTSAPATGTAAAPPEAPADGDDGSIVPLGAAAVVCGVAGAALLWRARRDRGAEAAAPSAGPGDREGG